MRKNLVDFNVQYPQRKYRHDKPDMKVLLEKKDETYVDVAEASSQQSVVADQFAVKSCGSCRHVNVNHESYDESSHVSHLQCCCHWVIG